jgi:SAM-dependent methyltransferase
LRTYREKRLRRRLARSSLQEVFTIIYAERLWGRPAEGKGAFFSGSGSHDPPIVERYVEAVSDWLRTLDCRPDVVDLGCGDFAVGAKLRRFCSGYIACDVVEPLIKWNRKRYAGLNVEFRVLDLTREELPHGRVAFLRQVLQHLGNRDISAIVPKVQKQYEYLIVTEHFHGYGNRDKRTGPDWRGVVLTDEPFNLQVRETRLLCEVPEHGGMIRTFLYRMH